MATATQRKATSIHRARAKSKGLARVELQVPQSDVSLFREAAKVMRGQNSEEMRRALASALSPRPKGTGLDLLRSCLPDEDAAEALNEILNEPRSSEIREIEW
jgi:hypothetical protein